MEKRAISFSVAAGALICGVLAALLALGLLFAAPITGYAATGDDRPEAQASGEVTTADVVLTTAKVKAGTSKKKSSSKKSAAKKSKKSKKSKKGNMDKYIALPKSTWVIATGRVGVPIYSKAKKGARQIASFQAKSSIVVDMSKMKKGKNYKYLKVKLQGKKRGYVKLSHVRLKTLDTKTFGLNIKGKKNKKNRVRAALCRWSLKWLGVRYAHATSLKYGLHCGSFVKKCYNKQGYDFTSASVHYLGTRGKGISRSKLKPADIVVYPYPWLRYGHSAIYLGKGLIVNSSGYFGTVYPRGGVRISSLDYRTPHAVVFRNVIGN